MLEHLIEADGEHGPPDAAVRRVIADGTVLLAIARRREDGARLLVRCEVPVGGTVIAMIPVFTHAEHLDAAYEVLPELQWLHVVSVDGDVLLGDLGRDDWLGINPWSGREFRLRPAKGSPQPSERAVWLDRAEVGIVLQALGDAREFRHGDPELWLAYMGYANVLVDWQLERTGWNDPDGLWFPEGRVPLRKALKDAVLHRFDRLHAASAPDERRAHMGRIQVYRALWERCSAGRWQEPGQAAG